MAPILAAFALAGTPASARDVPDCPLARTPYSIDTPVVDLLLDERARQEVDEAGILEKIPPAGRRTEPPTFMAILSLRLIAGMAKLPAAEVEAMNSRLAALPIREQDTAARCARYETGAPPAGLVPTRRPALLVFDKSTGFKDGPSVEAANEALRGIGERRGWQMVFTSSATAFTPALLRHFDAVIWNNVSGDVLTLGQRRAFRDYIEKGGGFAGVHGSGGDPIYLWDWYADTLVGARFKGHPSNPQFQTARIQVESAGDPITKGLGTGWSLNEEWYSFISSPRERGARILLTLDEGSYAPGALAMGDHPIAWTRCVGQGRSFYSAIGHRAENYRDANTVLLMEEGLAWAAGLGDRRCSGAGEKP